MWLGGEQNRELWYKQKFKEGQVIEGAVRDDSGRSQGTVLIMVKEALSTDSKGHFLYAQYITASDAHYRWWMDEGDGRNFKKKALYHMCETNSHDCEAVRGRSKAVHIEKFRLIGPKEWAAGVPSWAFKKPCSQAVEELDKSLAGGKALSQGAVNLPWMEDPPGESSSEGTEESSSEDVASKIKNLRKQLADLETKTSKTHKKGKRKDEPGHEPTKGKKKAKT